MDIETNSSDDPTTGRHDSRRPSDGAPIEYLQREIGRLLMKNETLRFEVVALRRKIERIEETVFGPGGRSLQRQMSPHLLRGLRDLCSNFPDGKSSAAQPAPDNLLSFRSQPRSPIHERDQRC